MTLSRVDIVARAKDLAGPTATPLHLNQSFDALLIGISTHYPVLKNQLLQGTTVADQAYQSEAFPIHYRLDHDNEKLYCDTNLLTFMELDEYFRWLRTSDTITTGSPSYYAVDIDNGRIYFRTTPDDAYAYQFYHTITHPPAGRTLAFTSGGTYEIRPGVTIAGATAAATAMVEYVKVTSGTWAAGTAAGNLILSSQSGAFTSENLNVGANLNVATVAADSSADDRFEHLLGARFDNALIYGLTAKACELTNPPQLEKSIFYEAKYEKEIFDQAIIKSSLKPAMRSNFWNPSWRVRRL